MTEHLTETDIKNWAYYRRKYRHKLGMCYKESKGYRCHGGQNYEECQKPDSGILRS